MVSTTHFSPGKMHDNEGSLDGSFYDLKKIKN